MTLSQGSKGLDTFHHTGRIVIGLCGITYCSLQAFITFQLAKLGLSTFKLFIFRIVISILLCVIGFVHVTMEVWLAVRFLKESEPYRPWYSHRGENEDYFLDAFSDISEWLTFLLFAAFSFMIWALKWHVSCQVTKLKELVLPKRRSTLC